MPTANGVELKPLRIAGLVAGGLMMAFSLAGWFPYLGASLTGSGSGDTGPGATNHQLIGMFFALWLVPWSLGLAVVLLAAAGWLRGVLWTLAALTGVMLLVSLIAYAIGSS
ncbi:hypothetical protein GCM10027271_51090 [Saccharopolyspora gloriosae]|uniref:Uncharacterized protein n=1 Tax=Saccharopolyspora gloriosae TaxID=455344 RepID=A0A840NJP4_9PSEU|nr:hypothetical protein [Saccharopolyspora gloriosae]MBB5068487.1 hypothetical protein [Saccharopolyspora gloriosae]